MAQFTYRQQYCKSRPLWIPIFILYQKSLNMEQIDKFLLQNYIASDILYSINNLNCNFGISEWVTFGLEYALFNSEEFCLSDSTPNNTYLMLIHS